MESMDLDIYHTFQEKLMVLLKNGNQPHAPLPSPTTTAHAAQTLHTTLPEEGLHLPATIDHLLEDVAPGLNGSSLSPLYYGFVTGGITPAARLADNLVTLFDQNAASHLPQETITTVVEDRALCMLLELLRFEPKEWPAKVFTTGATAGNILGLACGREFVLCERLKRKGLNRVPGEGILPTCVRAGVSKFQILTTYPHSSLGKAANIVGIGAASMVDVARKGHFLDFDTEKLERYLKDEEAVSIVVISSGEVNTGAFATHSEEEVRRIRVLCDIYGAWLHDDGAFGLFARLLPSEPKYAAIRSGTAGLELADSIGSDAHKLLNVPYDCGFFFTRHADVPPRIFGNVNAAYLNSGVPSGSVSGPDTATIVSPLNMRLENSARFRGLPVYATLLAYGREGYVDMIGRVVELARKIAVFVRESEHLELLPRGAYEDSVEGIFMCVLFRAKDDAKNGTLAERIKASRKMYVSGSEWEGKKATRIAVGKWDVDVERDYKIVVEVLSSLDHQVEA